MTDDRLVEARRAYAQLFAHADSAFIKRIFDGKCDDCPWIQSRIIKEPTP